MYLLNQNIYNKQLETGEIFFYHISNKNVGMI